MEAHVTLARPIYTPHVSKMIKIVLVETSHPGNIGSAARAMSVMGLKDLVLVRPQKFPDKEAVIMASHATDILHNAQVVDTLEEALADCQFIIGTSARERRVEWPLVDAREGATLVQQNVAEGKTAAILFGRERTGLTNDELKLCHYHVNIPTGSDYTSLNLAQAVQVLAYEVHVAGQGELPEPAERFTEPLASSEELEGFYAHLTQTMKDVEFLSTQYPKKLLLRLRRLYQRAQLSTRDVNILRGVLSASQRAADHSPITQSKGDAE
jgi:tRNA (cytidine32/uridine32-2'-O)-methyltransferase